MEEQEYVEMSKKAEHYYGLVMQMKTFLTMETAAYDYAVMLTILDKLNLIDKVDSMRLEFAKHAEKLIEEKAKEELKQKMKEVNKYIQQISLN